MFCCPILQEAVLFVVSESMSCGVLWTNCTVLPHTATSQLLAATMLQKCALYNLQQKNGQDVQHVMYAVAILKACSCNYMRMCVHALSRLCTCVCAV